MSEQIFCPYCNAAVNPFPGAGAGQPVTCPRCEESFRLLGTPSGSTGVTAKTVLQGSSSPGPLPPPETAARPGTNRQVAATVLVGMGLVALVGLTFALMTQGERRSHDTGLQRRSWKRFHQEDIPGAPVQKRAPLDLAALRYLPADTNLLAAAQIAELTQNADRMKALAIEIPGLAGGRARLDQTLERLTGLRTADVDHVVLGARLGQNGLSRPLLVVRTRRPYDPGEIRTRLQATRAPGIKDQPVYEISQGLVSFPDDRTLVFGLLAVPPRDMPTAQRSRGRGLPAEITDALRQQVPVGSLLWATGHSSDWTTILPLLKGFFSLDGSGQKVLARVRTVVLWLEMADRPTARGVVDCVDSAAAEALKKYLDGRLGERANLTVESQKVRVSVPYRK
jgi:hypothetical protein